MNNIYAALEIGTTRTVLAIGECETGGRLKITCHAEIPSTGVRKSQILDIPQATQSIRSVLHEIEKKQEAQGAKITIGNAFLAVSGQNVKADPYFGTAQIADGRVGDEELNEVLRSAHSMTLPKDRELLDIIDQDFVIDNLGGIASPKGMAGRILKLNTLQIHADRNRIQDARTAADAAHLEIREPLFAVTCAAEAVLEDYEKRNGVVVIDLGGGSTGYAAYCDGYAAATGVIGVGGDHVTNDIANAFQTANVQAEELKVTEANAMLTADSGATPRVKVPGSNPLLESRTISRRSLNTVVNARLKELFTVIRTTLEEQDLINRLHAGIVITGGGAQMAGIEPLIEQTLGLHVRLGRPIHIDGLDDAGFSPAYAAVAGALIYANRNDDNRSSFFDGIRRLFK